MSYILSYWPTFAVGLLCGLSSCSLGVMEILHGPDCPNYRFLPLWVRLPMMLWSISLAYRAFDLFAGLASHQPQMIGASAVLAGTWQTATLGVFLIETLRTRLSPKAQAWVARLEALARCWGKKGRSMADLTAQGVTVVAPGERRLPPEFR